MIVPPPPRDPQISVIGDGEPSDELLRLLGELLLAAGEGEKKARSDEDTANVRQRVRRHLEQRIGQGG